MEKLIGSKGFQLQCMGHDGYQILGEVHIYYDMDFKIRADPKITGRSCSKDKGIAIFPFDYEVKKLEIE